MEHSEVKKGEELQWPKGNKEHLHFDQTKETICTAFKDKDFTPFCPILNTCKTLSIRSEHIASMLKSGKRKFSYPFHIQAYLLVNNLFSILYYLLNLLSCFISHFHSFYTFWFVSSYTCKSPSPVITFSEITFPSNISHLSSSYKQLFSMLLSRQDWDWWLYSAKNRSYLCLWILV